MGRLFRAARVFETASQTVEASAGMQSTRTATVPAWLRAVESIPPSETLTRPYPLQHTAPSRRLRKPRHTFRPTRLVFPEDELRRTFYRDHPWELARPKMVLELDGKDARYRDWSRGLLQPGMPLSGESVVQRQLWIMENEPGVTKAQAYDRVRREFYQLRHEEEVEQRIAQEEARMVGAYFGMSALRVGLQLEDEQYERWKAWAAKEIQKIEAERSQAYTSFGDEVEEVAMAEEEQKAIS